MARATTKEAARNDRLAVYVVHGLRRPHCIFDHILTLLSPKPFQTLHSKIHTPSIIYILLILVSFTYSAAVARPSNDLIERYTAFNQTQLSWDDPYNYTFCELRPRDDPNGSFRQPYFSFKILFSRKDGITEEFFHRHWKTVHADLTLSQVDFALRVQRYTQFHQDDEHRNNVQRLLAAVGGSMQLAPYDGIAEFHTKYYETFERFILSVFADPLIVGDQRKFVNMSSPLHVMAGYENLIFGSGINTSNGYEGVLPGDLRLKYSEDN
ncbi:Nn.00g033440.m01.CDS01 [Neocucurbitaria sp. VM-36]